jgi:glycosyltransferase involved in cell wall biosynthesis
MASLLNQTYKNLEIIVVDDCSTDSSQQVLEHYSHLSNIRIVLLKENRGYANASNLGVGLSRGEFIMIAECDDFSEPEQVETLLTNMLYAATIGVAYSRSNIVDEWGSVIGNDYLGRGRAFEALCSKDAVISKEMMQRFLLGSCVIPNMSAALIRKQYYESVGGLSSSFRACADWEFWCRVAHACDFAYVAAPLNNFRTHSNTVRNTFKINVQVSEIFHLLYGASSQIELSANERYRFRVNMGYVLAFYMTYNRIGGFGNFLSIVKQCLVFEKLILLFLPFGFAKVLMKRLNIKIAALCRSNSSRRISI